MPMESGIKVSAVHSLRMAVSTPTSRERPRTVRTWIDVRAEDETRGFTDESLAWAYAQGWRIFSLVRGFRIPGSSEIRFLHVQLSPIGGHDRQLKPPRNAQFN